MKKSIKQYVVAVVLGLGIVVGVGSLQAQWTAPSVTPPGGNVPAPLNTGNSSQSKLGQLIINTNTTSNGPGPFAVGLSVFGKTILNGGVQIPTTDGANKVLTSDATGNASWQTPTGGTGTAGTWGRIYTFSKYVPINTSTGVSSWINVSLPNGDTMTAAALRISGTTNTDNAYDRFAIDEFAENSSYVEVDIPGQRVRVHMLKRSSLVANTAYPYANETVYLTIYTGSPGGGVASYAPGMWCGSEVGSNFAGGMVGPTVQCQGFNPATSCPVGFTRVLTGQNSGSYTCIKN